jgi:O-antigen ligase
MTKRTFLFPGWLTRQNFLVSGMLFLTFSPFFSVISFIGAALINVFNGEPTVFTRERKWMTGLIFLVSLCFALHNYLPEEIGPGKVAFTDYVPLLWFFYCISLKPFSDPEIKKILYAFLFTVPQQFFLAVGEEFLHWRGRFYFPYRKLPLLDIYWGPSEVGLKISASFFNPNILTLYAIMGAVFSLTLFFQEKKWEKSVDEKISIWSKRLFTFCTFIFSTVMLIWTGSRYAWAFLMVVVLLFAWMNSSRVLKILGTIFLVATSLAFVNLFFPTSWINGSLPSTLTSKLTVFSGDRQIYYNMAWELIQKKPFWGWGIGTFPQLVAGKLWYPVLHTHSLFLQLAVEIGLPAALLCLLFLGGLIGSTTFRFLRWQKGESRKDILNIGLLTAAATIFLMQFFDLALLMTYRLNFLFWLCLAIPYSNVSTSVQEAGRPVIRNEATIRRLT